MKWKWLWRHRDPVPQMEEVQRKLDQVEADEERVDSLVRRADKVMRENNFALTVRRALGAR